jgi:hypothetical protein
VNERLLVRTDLRGREPHDSQLCHGIGDVICVAEATWVVGGRGACARHVSRSLAETLAHAVAVGQRMREGGA